MDYDFCFSNTEILNWFEGKVVPPPVKQFKYLHTHPLVKPNFITEIEGLILKAGHDASHMALVGKPIEDLASEAVVFTKALSTFMEKGTDESAEGCLGSLRRLRKISLHISSLRRK